MYYGRHSEFQLAAGIHELRFAEIDLVSGGTDWDGVLDGLGTVAAGVGLVAGGAAIAGGSGGTASILGGAVALAGAVAIVAGGAQVIESAMRD